MNHANDNRPAEFDARVMAYVPGLKKLSRRYLRDKEARADLVTDTIIYSLANWHKFREEGGLWAWMTWNMRAVAGAERAKKRVALIEDADQKYSGRATSDGRQEVYAELSGVLRRATTRNSKLAVRQAMGTPIREIAAEMGVSNQRVQFLVERGREELRGAA